MIIKFIVYLVILVYLVLIVMRNSQTVNMDFIFIRYDISVFILILISLLIGALLSTFYYIRIIFRLKKENKNLRKTKNEK